MSNKPNEIFFNRLMSFSAAIRDYCEQINEELIADANEDEPDWDILSEKIGFFGAISLYFQNMGASLGIDSETGEIDPAIFKQSTLDAVNTLPDNIEFSSPEAFYTSTELFNAYRDMIAGPEYLKDSLEANMEEIISQAYSAFGDEIRSDLIRTGAEKTFQSWLSKISFADLEYPNETAQPTLVSKPPRFGL